MELVAKINGYFLYYDEKYNDFIVVTPNYEITRYWKRLDSETSEFFNKKYDEFIKSRNLP